MKDLKRLALHVLLLAVLLLSGQVHPVRAQSASIRFTTLSVEDGLSQSTVRAILQDNQGFMWFGTDDGLNKYDGYTFTLYKHDPESASAIADNGIRVLFQDHQGSLWVGTTNGLDRFNHENETFSHFKAPEGSTTSLTGNTVNSITEDAQGNLWVATADGGLNRLDANRKSWKYFAHEDKNPDSPVSDTIRALLSDTKNGLWIGTSEGLDFLDLASGKFTHFRYDSQNPYSLSENNILSLFRDRMGNLWIGTEEGGLNRYNPADGTFTRYQSHPNNPYALSSDMVRAVYEDQSGHLWIGGRDGLDVLNREDEYFSHYQHNPNDPHSLSNDSILSIYADRSGVVWIGTYGGGLSKYVQNNERFTLYQHRPATLNSLSNDVVYAIYEDRQGVVWVGTMDGGLNRLDPDAGTFSFFTRNAADPSSISSNDVRAILEDRRGNLWVGTNGGGLNRLNRETGHFSHYMHDPQSSNSLSDNQVTTLYEDRLGNLWIGTREGLNLLDRTTYRFTHFRNDSHNPSSLNSNFIQAIAEDHLGRLWVGTNNGLNVMDPKTGTFQHYQNDPKQLDSLSDNHILSILETDNQSIWVGTQMGGLNRFDLTNRSFQHYSQKQGLPGDAVYGIQADRNGYLWLSTNRGLARFEPRSGTFRSYDRSDGLQSYEFNPGASFQNSHGRMYFGGIQGFNAFDPARIEDSKVTPSIVITALKKFNQTERIDLKDGEKITFNYTDNFISFEFAALDYSAPEKNQYAYKLEGFDKDWIFAGTRRYASYTNLRGGDYTFRVIGSNQDGVWNDKGTSIVIEVIPPIWERWWFIGSVAIVIAGISLGAYQYRLMRIRSETHRLEELVNERTQEIERRREVAEGLREILAILNSNRSLEECLDTIVPQITRLMKAHGVIIFRYDGEKNIPAVLASNLPIRPPEGVDPAEYDLLPFWLTQPLLDGQRLLLPDLAERRSMRPELSIPPFDQYGALMGVPLTVSDRIDGGVALLYQKTRVFFKEDIQMAMSFADHAALAIANSRLRSQAEQIAVVAERNRLARDLHDAVTQTLFATSLIAEVLPRLWDRDPETGKQKIQEIRELTRGALAEMRTLLLELRPTALEDVSLPDLLRQLGEAFTGRARIPVTLNADAQVDLPVNVKIGFYRIVQEALNNIQKHSRATHVEIEFGQDETSVFLMIRDDGVGFEAGHFSSNHFGLKIMEERAQSVNAQFSVSSQPGQGTRIRVCWERPPQQTETAE